MVFKGKCKGNRPTRKASLLQDPTDYATQNGRGVFDAQTLRCVLRRGVIVEKPFGHDLASVRAPSEKQRMVEMVETNMSLGNLKWVGFFRGSL